MEPTDPNSTTPEPTAELNQQPPAENANSPEQPVVEGVRPNSIHPNNPQSPRRITAAERRAQVMEYKLLGASVRQIAAKLGMGPTRVHQIVCEELAKQTDQTRMATEQYRQMHLNQLEKIEFGIMQQAAGGDVFAIDRVIKIQQQRERLIPGLAIAQKVVTGVGGIDDDGNPSGSAPIILQLTPDEANM